MISGLKFHGPPEELLMERISIVMKYKKILLFFFVLYILSAQPCSSMQKACTGPRYTLLLSIV